MAAPAAASHVRKVVDERLGQGGVAEDESQCRHPVLLVMLAGLNAFFSVWATRTAVTSRLAIAAAAAAAARLLPLQVCKAPARKVLT